MTDFTGVTEMLESEKKKKLINKIVDLENQIDHVFDEKIPIYERIDHLDQMSIPGLKKRFKERSNYFSEKLQ